MHFKVLRRVVGGIVFLFAALTLPVQGASTVQFVPRDYTGTEGEYLNLELMIHPPTTNTALVTVSRVGGTAGPEDIQVCLTCQVQVGLGATNQFYTIRLNDD